jgi:hypothetical protein
MGKIDNLVDELIEGKHIEPPTTLTSPLLRGVYKHEMLVLQRVAKEMQAKGMPMSGEWLSGILMGMETFARRIQDIERRGLEAVYAENFKDQEKQSPQP